MFSYVNRMEKLLILIAFFKFEMIFIELILVMKFEKKGFFLTFAYVFLRYSNGEIVDFDCIF